MRLVRREADRIDRFRKQIVSGVSPFDVPGHACRPGCGACCIAPSITSPIPGMPDGKPSVM
jgi:hypothetical protein